MIKDKTDRIKRIARTQGFIAGIHNYCDRWCRKCSMTSRCSVFAMEQEEVKAGDGDVRKNFREQQKETLEAAMALLREMAENAGIDLNGSSDVGEGNSGFDTRENHLLVRAAMRYAVSVNEWFDLWEQELEEKRREPAERGRPHLQVVDSTPDRWDLGDLTDIILWYSTFIYAKIDRAVRQDSLEGEACLQDFPRDADGSAKVALIAMDRSIAAWSGILEYAPEGKAELAGFIHELERLRRTAEWAFPGARTFIRPGFDDV